jgi:nucleoid-associated protein YgaU
LAFWLSTRPELSAEARALRSVPDDRPVAAPTENQPQTPDVQPPKTNTEQTSRFHVVQKGDTLSGISVKYYGSSRYWQKILNANRDNIRDPNRLIPGSRLAIPE